MLSPKQSRTKIFWKIMCLIGVISMPVHIFFRSSTVPVRVVKPRTDLCQSMKHEENETSKYIFDLYGWREVMRQEERLAKKNQTLWCDVPVELRLLTESICRLHEMSNCTRLPCRALYSSPTTLTDIKCIRGGQMIRTDDNIPSQNHSHYQCKRGFALDLFIKKSENHSYPSLIANSFSPLSDDLYVNLFHNKYRNCSSMWGLMFNYESIVYHPWTADREKLKLFNATFGYDRSLYDFTPRSWLFNHIEQIKFTSQRLTIEQAMDSKKPINSVTSPDVYWTNSPVDPITQKETMTTSYIKAPILWMNSNCRTKSQRTQYMSRLMKYIDVDNFGTCGKNIRQVPEQIVRIQDSTNQSLRNISTYNWAEEKLALSKEYLFTIAIENSLTYDYITEKLWQPLIIGSVPIYLGAPNVDDWLPCQTNCIIDLRKFKTPRDAAMYIKTVAKNKTLYQSYHQWRNEPVSPKFQNILDHFERIGNYSLECVLCDMSYRVGQGENAKEIKEEITKAIGRF